MVRFRSALFALLPAAFCALSLHGQSILTVAGGGSDDGRPALAASLNEPRDVAVDAAGNLYVADAGNNRVVKVSASSGLVTTVAGNGVYAFTGDGGPATAASLAEPLGVALDAAGNVFIADSQNNRIRKVSLATGVISSIAGGGAGGDGGAAVSASLNGPSGVAVDAAGNVYVAETNRHRVRRISVSAGTITTVAGTGTEGYSGDGGPATAANLRYPKGVALDAAGNLIVGDSQNYRVRRVTASTGVLTTVAGTGTSGFSGDGGPATAAQLTNLMKVHVDRAGNLLVADLNNNRVRLVSASTGVITTIAGNGKRGYSGDGGAATAASLNLPFGIATDAAGNLVIVEWGSSRVRRVVALTGIISTVAGGGTGGDGGPGLAAVLSGPSGIAVDAAGNLYVVDQASHRVRKVSGLNGAVTTLAGNGLPGYSGDGGPAAAASLYSPEKVAVDGAGNVYIADILNARVRKVSAGTGIITTFAGGGTGGDGGPADQASLGGPNGVTLDTAGNVFVSEAYSCRVRKVAAGTGVITTVAGNGSRGFSGDGGPATAAALHQPEGIAVDAAGTLYIADSQNSRVRKVAAGTGTITTFAGYGRQTTPGVGDGGPATSAYLQPWGVAVDRAGDLLIADTTNDRIRKVSSATGIISTIVGSGRAISSGLGDGGPATEAGLGNPEDVKIDAAGNLLVADTSSNRIRAVGTCATPAAPPLLSPAEAVTVSGTVAAFSWSPVANGFSYDVLLDTTNPPTKAVASLRYATQTPFSVPPGTTASFSAQNLLPGTQYFWQVVARGDPFCPRPSSSGSPVRSVRTAGGCAAPPVPALSSPADGAPGIPSATTLSWAPSSGAGKYDVYFGASNPPPLAASGVTSASYAASGLVPASTWYWYVVAHASCDTAKTSSSPVRAFRVAGTSCAPPGSFALTTPANGATEVPAGATLGWTSSANASSYDVSLGIGGATPLYLAGVTGTSLVLPALAAGAEYSWKVVARTSCDPSASSSSAVRTFRAAGACTPPGAPSFTSVPPGTVDTGQTYVLAWRAAPGLDARGGYAVERSTSSSFSPLLDTVTTTSPFASFVAPSPGTLHHRVRGVPACDPSKTGPWSPTATVTVVPAKPNVVFSRVPEAVVAGLGERLEDRKATFALENVGATPVHVIVSRQELSSVPFFSIVDPAGGDAARLTLAPRVPKALEVRFSGPRNDVSGSYQGLVVVSATGAGLAVTPYAFVSLKVGSSPDAVPEFRRNGVATEYVAFPGLTGSDDGRPPFSVDVHNPGSSPLELAAEVGPELWLTLEPGWNATPIPPGASRTLRLSTRRGRAPNGSALPRYTYVTLRTKGGTNARLLVQDNEAPLLSTGRGASAVRPEASFLVPSVAHVTSALGNTFVSRLSLSNAGTEPVQADLVFTPASSDALTVDGFDAAAIRRATVVVPPNDLVQLSDPLVLLFGLEPPVSGTLEVRAPPERAGFLAVASSVDAPSRKGGSFGFAMPVWRSGEGLRAGATAALAAVASDAAERTNLILAETTGVDAVDAKITLYDRNGVSVGEENVRIPRWGQRQLSRIVERLGGATGSRAGRLQVSVTSGGGALAAVTTVVDNANDDAATFVARSAESDGSASRALRPTWARAIGTVKSLVPALVNGYQTFPAAAAPFTFRSVMGFSSLSTAEAVFRLTYFDLASGATIAREVRVPARKTVEYTNVLEQLFGVGAGVKSQGPLFVESDLNGLLWCRVASSLEQGTIGDSFPVIPIPSESLSGGGVARMIALDGLEQSLDRSRGTRSNLLLNEVLGKPVTLVVSLYEAGNRSSPIAEREVSLGALEKVQLSTVFADLDLDSEERRKDRTNVLCTVRAISGEGLASAVVTTIDNRTGDTRNIPLAPSGAGAGVVSIGF